MKIKLSWFPGVTAAAAVFYAALLFVPQSAVAGDETIFMMDPPVIPDTMLFVSDTHQLYRKAYNYNVETALRGTRCPNDDDWFPGNCESNANGMDFHYDQGSDAVYIKCTGSAPATSSCATSDVKENCCSTRCPTGADGATLCNSYYWGMGDKIFDDYCPWTTAWDQYMNWYYNSQHESYYNQCYDSCYWGWPCGGAWCRDNTHWYDACHSRCCPDWCQGTYGGCYGDTDDCDNVAWSKAWTDVANYWNANWTTWYNNCIGRTSNSYFRFFPNNCNPNDGIINALFPAAHGTFGVLAAMFDNEGFLDDHQIGCVVYNVVDTTGSGQINNISNGIYFIPYGKVGPCNDFDCYPIDMFNYYTSSINTALQAMLGYWWPSTNNHDTLSMLSNTNFGLDNRFGLSRFNYYRTSSICTGLPGGLCNDGTGGSIDIPNMKSTGDDGSSEVTASGPPHRVARAVTKMFVDVEGSTPDVNTGIPPGYTNAKNNHVKGANSSSRNPVGGALQELLYYFSNTAYPTSYTSVSPTYSSGNTNPPWSTTSMLTNQSYMGSNAYVLALVFGNPTESSATIQSRALDLWKYDMVDDAASGYSSYYTLNSDSTYCPYPSSTSGNRRGCVRQSVATDIISINANAGSSESGANATWNAVASKGQGRHYPLANFASHTQSGSLAGDRYHFHQYGGDELFWRGDSAGWGPCSGGCTLGCPFSGWFPGCHDWTIALGDANSAISGMNCKYNSNPSNCWLGLPEALMTMLNSYQPRNVNTNRPYSLTTPVVLLDQSNPYDCSSNFYFVSDFMVTPGTMSQGNIVGYPYGDQATCPITGYTFENGSSGSYVLDNGGNLNPGTGTTPAPMNLGIDLKNQTSRSIFTNLKDTWSLVTWTEFMALSDATKNTQLGLLSIPGGLGTGDQTAQVTQINSQVTGGVSSYWYYGTSLGGEYSWRMGDIFHSQPVIVQKPSPYYADVRIDQIGLGAQKADPAYVKFVNANQSTSVRPPMLYVGANDGMLHAFKLTLGSGYSSTEQWAYIPSFLLPGLNSLTPAGLAWGSYTFDGNLQSNDVIGKPFLFDGSPSVADVWIKKSGGYNDTKSCDDGTTARKCSEEWRTYLVSGVGRGGKGIFVMDVTTYNSPVLKAELRYDDSTAGGNPVNSSNDPSAAGKVKSKYLSYTTSDPLIAKIKVCNSNCDATSVEERWVAIFGAGYSPYGDPTDSLLRYCVHNVQAGCNPSTSSNIFQGRALIVFDLLTKKKLFEYGLPYATAASSGSSEFQCILGSSMGSAEGPSSLDQRNCLKFAFAAPPTGADYNRDGYLDAVYIGDLGGQLWRFDFTKTGAIDGTTGMVSICGSTATYPQKTDASGGLACWSGRLQMRTLNPYETACSSTSETDAVFKNSMLDDCDYRCVRCATATQSTACVASASPAGSPKYSCGTNDCAWECKSCYGVSGWPLGTCAASGAGSNPCGFGEGRNWKTFWSAPSVAQDNFGRYYVLIGSGDKSNVLSTALNKKGTLYAVQDTFVGANAFNTTTFTVEPNIGFNQANYPWMRKVTSTTHYYDPDGWYRDLASGEKILFPPAAVGGDTFFTSFLPAAEYNSGYKADVLERAYLGQAYLYAADLISGGSPNVTLGSNNFWGGLYIGRDIPSAPKVVARPPDSTHKDGETAVIVHTGSGKVEQIRTAKSKFGRNMLQPVNKVIFWRETL